MDQEGDLCEWRDQRRDSGNGLGEMGWQMTWTRVPTDGANLYTLTGGEWDGVTGAWSTK